MHAKWPLDLTHCMTHTSGLIAELPTLAKLRVGVGTPKVCIPLLAETAADHDSCTS